GIGGNDHFIAGPDSQRAERNLNGSRSVGASNPVPCSLGPCKFALKIGHLRVACSAEIGTRCLAEGIAPPIAAPQDAQYRFLFVLVENRPIRKGLSPHRFTTVNCQTV